MSYRVPSLFLIVLTLASILHESAARCQSGYYLTKGKCKRCSPQPACTKSVVRCLTKKGFLSKQRCLKCKSSSYLQSGICRACTSQAMCAQSFDSCGTGALRRSLQCMRCKDGFYLSSKKQCRACLSQPQCQSDGARCLSDEAAMKNRLECVVCKSGYLVGPNAECVEIVSPPPSPSPPSQSPPPPSPSPPSQSPPPPSPSLVSPPPSVPSPPNANNGACSDAACFCSKVSSPGYFADTSSGCSSYYWCANPLGGESSSWKKSCQSGLLFDDTQTACNWASLVNCATPAPSPPPPPAVPSPPTSPSPVVSPGTPPPSPVVSPGTPPPSPVVSPGTPPPSPVVSPGTPPPRVPPPPSNSTTRPLSVVYVTNWAQYLCRWYPKDLDANLATHINYAFAFLNADFTIKMIEWNDDKLYAQTMALKQQNPDLKVSISIGGWTMNDPGPYCTRFRDMVSTKANRAAFIQDALAFSAKWGFDGIDLDWEYPGRADRCGDPVNDRRNYVLLCKEFKEAVKASGRDLLLTAAVSAGALSWGGIDAAALEPYMDYLYIMTYDMHGAWDSTVNFHTPWENALVDNWSVKLAVQHYTSLFPPERVILGIGAYGRSWTLKSTSQTRPGSPASGAGPKQPCTKEAGYIAYHEIQDLIAKGAVVTVDDTAKAAYLVHGNVWVSFDTLQTIYAKIQAAKEFGVGGYMVWAADLDETGYPILEMLMNPYNPGPPAPAPPRLPPPSPPPPSPPLPPGVYPPPSPPPAFDPDGPMCAPGVPGQCSNPAHCCSKWGYCGVTSSHCGSGCAYQCKAEFSTLSLMGKVLATAAGSSNGTDFYSVMRGARGHPVNHQWL